MHLNLDSCVLGKAGDLLDAEEQRGEMGQVPVPMLPSPRPSFLTVTVPSVVSETTNPVLSTGSLVHI